MEPGTSGSETVVVTSGRDREPALAGLLPALRTAVAMLLLLTVLTGVIYPLVVTAIAQITFNDAANGSMIERDGEVIGSALIGQDFFGQPGYVWGRPSAAGEGYDANASSGSNLGPTNPALIARIEETVAAIRAAHPERNDEPIPADLVTSSASGLDPHISPAAADFQAPRIARERGLSEDQVRELIEAHTAGRTLGFLGEPRVNVLELNLALDALTSAADTD